MEMIRSEKLVWIEGSRKIRAMMNNASENMKFKALERMMERGIISRPKAAFWRSERSFTKQGVVFNNVWEKNCHGRSPLKRKIK